MIGHLPSEETAHRFSDFLYVKGISNLVELDTGHWAVWIHSEDELAKAKEFFTNFLGNPNAPEFVGQAQRAAKLKARRAAEAVTEAPGRPIRVEGRDVVESTRSPGLGRLTLALVLCCLGVAAFSRLGETPAFLHFGVPHLIFNMLALVHLGGLIEGRQGMWRLGLIMFVLAVVSNVAQYWYGGPNFGGMSGVIFGLAGYVWTKGRYDLGSGLYLHPQSMALLMIWFFLCLFGVMGQIANVAHAVGLGGGLLWGYLSCVWVRRRGG